MSELRRSAPPGSAEQLQDKRGRAKQPQPKALFSDPLAGIAAGPYREPIGGLTFNGIRNSIELMPVLAVIIMIRVNQVAAFSRPARNQFDVGFRVGLRDEKSKPTDASRKQAQKLTRFIERGGVKEGAGIRDGFYAYLSKSTEDALTYAQWCTEIVPDYTGRPSAFYAVDSSTMRLAIDHRDNVFADDGDDVRYIQVVDGMPAAGFAYDEMIFGVMNPTSNIRQHGYGVSPVERVSKAIAQLIYAFDHNSRVFEQGANVRGLINFPGMPDKTLLKMRKTFDMWLRGPSAAHTMPLVNCPQPIQVSNLAMNNRDMEYSSWADYLIKIACGAFLISPEELNLSYGGIGQTSSIGGQPNNREKILESRERGLVPLLTHFATAINRRILQRIDPDFALSFVGLNAMTRMEREQYNSARVMTSHTVNELRSEDDLKPLKGGDTLLNPAFIQAAMGIAPALDGADDGQEGAQGMAGLQPTLNYGDDPSAAQDDGTQEDQSAQAEKGKTSWRMPKRTPVRPGQWTVRL